MAAREEFVTFRWTLDEETTRQMAADLAATLQRAGGSADVAHAPVRFPFLVVVPVVIAGVVVLTALTEQVCDWWQRRNRPGLLIHAMPSGRLELIPLDEVPFGQVVYVGADGKTLVHVDVSRDCLKDILRAAPMGLHPASGSPTREI